MLYSQNDQVSPNGGCAYGSHLRADILYQDFVFKAQFQLSWIAAVVGAHPAMNGVPTEAA